MNDTDLDPTLTLLSDFLEGRLPPGRFQELLLARARQEEAGWPHRYVPILEDLVASVDAYRPRDQLRFPDDVSEPQLRRACQRAREALLAARARGKPRRKPRTRRERRRRRPRASA